LMYSRRVGRLAGLSYTPILQSLTGNRGTLNREPDIRPYRGKFPQIAASAYIDPAAVIIGDVVIGEDSSVWPRTVVRGDVHYIRIGNRTNVQDGCVLHVMKDQYPLILGDDVTVGHSVTLHGCTIELRVLVGMGCIILNGAVVGTDSIVAAGALITEGTVIPPGSLVMGSPGKVRRALTAVDRDSIARYAERYAGYKEIYRAEALERGERVDWSREDSG
jgi:gamma-carbonic anhydrase